MHSRATDWHTGASVSLDHSQQVLRGAGLCPPSAETPGGFTWSRLFLPCWSPSWYSWISRSQLWSSTGRSTSWRSGFFLFLLPYLKGLLQRTLPGSRGGCWSLSQVYMGTGGSTPESAGSSSQGTMWAFGGSVPCPRVPRQCFEGVLSIFYSIFCPDKCVEEKKKRSQQCHQSWLSGVTTARLYGGGIFCTRWKSLSDAKHPGRLTFTAFYRHQQPCSLVNLSR